MIEFLKSQFDKLLLASLILICLGVVLHLVHHTQDAQLINWGTTLVSGVIGSLLTLITGNVTKSNAGQRLIQETQDKKD